MTVATGTLALLRATRREPNATPPVWFLRQAGRYLAEYRAIRARLGLLEICAQPEIAAEVTLQPVRRFGLDAAIIFADILLPIVPMGLDLAFAAGEGPVIQRPVRKESDVAALRPVDVEASLGGVLEAIRLVRAELEGRVAVIGFAGAPFTIASYVIEGGASRHFLETKRLMYGAPALWDGLMSRLTTVVADFLVAQAAAGAQVLQLFDSWVGALSPGDYRRYVLPYTRRVFDAVRASGVPSIHFGTGTATLLEAMVEAGGDVIGLDWRVPLDEGWARIGPERGVQGNLDPAALFAPKGELRARVRDVVRRAGSRPGHIFNVGHGLLPTTPPDRVQLVVDTVREAPAGAGES